MRFIPILLITTVLSTPVFATEKVISEGAQKSLNVTIYNADRALVKDSRTVQLDSGLNQISFTGVSSQIIPQSALLQGVDIRTQEQNFNFDLIDYNSLMTKSVGQQVTTEYIDPATGNVSVGTAELLAYNGSPVLKIKDKIETHFPGRVIFNKVPDNLRAKPTLTIDTMTGSPGSQVLNLSYLTTGLSWSADYVAELNPEETRLNLNGLVTLTNHSGADYKNAKLQLVAGDVNVVRNYMPAPRMAMAKYEMAADASYAMGAENLSDFYLYTLPRKTDILSNQTKQVALLSGQNIGFKKTYEFYDVFNTYTEELKKVSPQIYIAFDNKKDNNLGLALPKGTVRLYKADKTGNMLLVGEDRIDHTPNGEEVRLNTGKSFDLTADMKRTAYNKLPGNTNAFEATYQITLKNGGENKAEVIVSQSFPAGWRIVQENIPHATVTANRVKWTVSVPANGRATLTYDLIVK